jgi:type IV pilus assembly protein PilP
VSRKRVPKNPGKEPRKGRSKLVALFLLAFFSLSAGCGGGGSVPPSTGGKTAPVPKKAAPPAPAADKKQAAVKDESEYRYDPTGKPDPFKPFIQLAPARMSTRTTPLTPLERYDLNQLKLVAIIATPGGNMGLVEDSSGKGYFLKKGTSIGKNEGKVTRILSDRVIVEETFQDVLGQTKVNEVSLILHKIEEGGES